MTPAPAATGSQRNSRRWAISISIAARNRWPRSSQASRREKPANTRSAPVGTPIAAPSSTLLTLVTRPPGCPMCRPNADTRYSRPREADVQYLPDDGLDIGQVQARSGRPDRAACSASSPSALSGGACGRARFCRREILRTVAPRPATQRARSRRHGVTGSLDARRMHPLRPCSPFSWIY